MTEPSVHFERRDMPISECLQMLDQRRTITDQIMLAYIAHIAALDDLATSDRRDALSAIETACPTHARRDRRHGHDALDRS